ncbi:MAG: fucose isomerase [Caldilineaceae bacterium]|nr:fucose isomerase [Caldilineaceae bacterium]
MSERPKLGVIVTNRNFFADSLVQEGRTQILDALEKLGIDAVIVSPEETRLGVVETWEDAKQCGALFKRHQDEIMGILVSLPNFGNEKGIADAIRLSGLNVPVLVHAFPDTTQQLTVAGRRDAFCGKLSLTNNLYQYGIDFSITQNHVLDPDSDAFARELDKFVRLCRVVKGMRSLRLGAIGARPQAFNTVRYSEKLLEANGISVVTLDLSEVFGWAEKLGDDDRRVVEKLADIRGYARADAAPPPSLVKMAKLGVVIGDWMDEFELDATAIQCWETLQHNYGINACTIMSMMSDRFMPSACEVDIAGTLSMAALQLASNAPAGLVDWNNNYDDELDKCLYFHCGNWAKSLVSEIEIVPAEVLGTTLGEENTWGAVNARSLSGPMTYARIDTDDRRGVIKTYIGQGQFTDDPLSLMSGTKAVVEVQELQALLRYICKNGFAHHCAMTLGHVSDILDEAFNTYLGWETYHHQ